MMEKSSVVKKQCRRCGRWSTMMASADFCPHCGHDNSKGCTLDLFLIFIALATVLISILIALI